MDEIDNPKVQFFLEHQDEIEKWAEIKTEAAIKADEFFRSVQAELEEQAKNLEGDLVIWRLKKDANDPDDHYPKIGLYRKKWMGEKDYPRAMVCFEWKRNKSDFREGYVGISGWGENACRELERTLKENPKEFTWYGPQWEQEKMWPALRKITPPKDYWTQLPKFREQIANEIIQLWKDCHALLEKTLNG